MKTHIVSAALAAALAATLAGAVSAQQPPPAEEKGLPQLALTTIPAKGGAKLTVTSPSFQPGGDIPFEYTQYRTNTFPGLTWSAGPSGTRSYAIIMQDTDAIVRGGPILHWTMYNIPAGTTALAKGMSAPPAGATYGPNIRGSNQAYMGPRTPAGPKHRYHFQVFALDTTLPADPALTYDAMSAAMKDHVLASGEVIGLGQVDPNAPPPPARAGAPAQTPPPAK
jgi:para-nitrobenzyl esterase